jgi:hypothetical protein
MINESMEINRNFDSSSLDKNYESRREEEI